MLNPKQEAEIFRRLDAQAAAIRDLRERLAVLEGGDRSIPAEPAREESTDVQTTGSRGVFVLNPRCCVCGIGKEAGRSTLLCARCARVRQDGITGKGPRVNYTRCGNCGETKGANTTVLCQPCSKAYTRWRKEHA